MYILPCNKANPSYNFGFQAVNNTLNKTATFTTAPALVVLVLLGLVLIGNGVGTVL